MAAYLILGAGKFGRLALARLTRQDAQARFLVVDRDRQALEAARDLAPADRVVFRECEAIAFLEENLREDAPWDWLIPMVPVHVAFAWLWQTHLARRGWEVLEVPATLGKSFPVAQRGPQGELYLSRADHLCPDDCPEPEVCPVSGEPRDRPLYEELAGSRLPGFRWQVVASQQLAPGVGGFPPGRLARLAQELAGFSGKILLATACRCHAVVHALKSPDGGDP